MREDALKKSVYFYAYLSYARKKRRLSLFQQSSLSRQIQLVSRFSFKIKQYTFLLPALHSSFLPVG